jgi:hypothetical protein
VKTMPSFFFSVVSATIINTRSKHKDTDYLVFTVQVGASAPQTQVKYLGDLNSGNYPINLAFLGIDLEPGNQFVFNYMIVNAGSAKQGVAEEALQKASVAWANGQGPTSNNLTGALEDGQTWFNDELKGVLNPSSCDGMVAAEQDHFTYEDLTSMLSNNIFNHQTHHPGVRSPSGCGPNSQYSVTWEIDLNQPLF